MNEQTKQFIDLIRNKEDEKLIIQYYIENGKEIDIHVYNDKVFINSCENGQLETVKILIEKGADIHAQNDKAFIESCWYGKMEIVKLLIDLKVNIHAQNNKAFIECCKTKRFDIVKYLFDCIKNKTYRPIESECFICKGDKKENLIELSCRHIFHIDCLFTWFNIAKIKEVNCPYCQTPIEWSKITFGNE